MSDSLEAEYMILGELMGQIHGLFSTNPIRSWEIAPHYLGGQINPDIDLARARRTLNNLAYFMAGMAEVTEDRHPSYVSMFTVGKVGPVEVKLWAIVSQPSNPVPNPEVQP